MNGMRIFFALVMAVGTGLGLHSSLAYETETTEWGAPKKKYPGRSSQVWVTPLILPFVVFLTVTVVPMLAGGSLNRDFRQAYCWNLLALLAWYDTLLLLVLPLLRKFLSARACATLWIIPAFLYWIQHLMQQSAVPAKVVLRIPRPVMTYVLVIWIIGGVLVALWQLLSHRYFRKRLLSAARPVQDETMLRLWQEEQDFIERKKPIPLQYCSEIRTPMTIGLFGKTMQTLLPERDYTPDDLRLIFRHELRHVQRLDVETKVFFGFLKAFCWFVPPVWLAAGQASADLELSCDEMVVYGAGEQTRRQYAELLLQTAGDDRGFSTCLSASARSLRYRLKQVLSAKRKLTGTIFVAAVAFFLTLSCGLVTVTAEFGPMGEVVLPMGGTMKEVRFDGRELTGWDEAAILAYLAEVPVTKLGETQEDGYLRDVRHAQIVFRHDNGQLGWLNLSDDRLEVVGKRKNSSTVEQYRLDAPMDWSQLGFE